MEDVKDKVQEQPVEPMSVVQIMEQIGIEGKAGNLGEVIKLGNQLKKFQADIQKAEADKLKKEAEELAGVREKLAIKIWRSVSPDVKAELEAVKAKGYTFKLDEGDVTYKSVSLSVPTIKTRTGGGGGGSTGALKAQTGLSRHELVSEYATAEEQREIANAEANATSRPDSARYSAEKPVIKRILADNPNLIKH